MKSRSLVEIKHTSPGRGSIEEADGTSPSVGGVQQSGRGGSPGKEHSARQAVETTSRSIAAGGSRIPGGTT